MFALHNNTHKMKFIKCNYDAWDEAEKKGKRTSKRRGVAPYKLAKRFKRT